MRVYLTSHLVMVWINVVLGKIPHTKKSYTVYILLCCHISAHKLKRIWCNMFRAVFNKNRTMLAMVTEGRYLYSPTDSSISLHYNICIDIFNLTIKYADDSIDPACNLHHSFHKQKEWNSSEFHHREG